MAAPDRAAAGSAGGESSPPLWQSLRYPTEQKFIELVERHPEHVFDGETGQPRGYYALAPWVRLGWPSADLYDRAKGNPKLARMAWADVQKAHPDRPGVPEREQDLWRILHFWPKHWGEPFTEVTLRMKNGVHFASTYASGKDPKGQDISHAVELHYGPGVHRVPVRIAAELRYADQKAYEEYIGQFIPKVHQDRLVEISARNYPGMVQGA